MPLGVLFTEPADLGYPLLFALVAGESAGLLLPGETALILAGTPSEGKLDTVARTRRTQPLNAADLR